MRVRVVGAILGASCVIIALMAALSVSLARLDDPYSAATPMRAPYWSSVLTTLFHMAAVLGPIVLVVVAVTGVWLVRRHRKGRRVGWGRISAIGAIGGATFVAAVVGIFSGTSWTIIDLGFVGAGAIAGMTGAAIFWCAVRRALHPPHRC